MKRIELLGLSSNITRAFGNEKYPFKLSYALNKNTKKLQTETKDTWDAIDGMKSAELKKLLEESAPIHQKQMQELAKTDRYNDGTDSERKAFVSLKPSKKLIAEFDTFVKERENVMQEEVKFKFYTVPMSVVENLEFTGYQMGILEKMIEEEAVEK